MSKGKINIMSRLGVSHPRRGDISALPEPGPPPSQPGQEEGMPAKGTYQEFIHSHPSPISVQVMPRVRLSPLGSSRVWIRLISVCVMCDAPITFPTIPLPRPVSL